MGEMEGRCYTFLMQIPKRRAELLRTYAEQDEPFLATAAAVERMKRELEQLEKHERPRVVEDLSVALQKGDLSENAEYKDARAKLSRIDSRMFSINERLQRHQVIEEGVNADGVVRLGCTVVVQGKTGHRLTYQLVGPHEASPTRGKISHLSPLGAALLNHRVGEVVSFTSPAGAQAVYTLIEIL